MLQSDWKEIAMRNRRKVQMALGVLLLATVFSVASSAQAGRITGTVKSPSGAPVISAWVIVSQNGVEKGKSLTGDDGKYYISNLGDGTYQVVVVKSNRQLYRAEVNLPADGNYDIQVR